MKTGTQIDDESSDVGSFQRKPLVTGIDISLIVPSDPILARPASPLVSERLDCVEVVRPPPPRRMSTLKSAMKQPLLKNSEENEMTKVNIFTKTDESKNLTFKLINEDLMSPAETGRKMTTDGVKVRLEPS